MLYCVCLYLCCDLRVGVMLVFKGWFDIDFRWFGCVDVWLDCGLLILSVIVGLCLALLRFALAFWF